ncbi:MAG: 2-amino-4-hydroxy-6-hydroxymethyldihydropteridine diphosphokinase [Gallionellaceae bacterium]|nr:2-amino-4-hydroxy-6-hydroxymethyldihydropteridine diphosphokinase [Gallionellaceae bacterium]
MERSVYVGLGSNLADPAAQVLRGMEALNRLPKTQVRARSSLYRSAPVGFADQPDFINAVAGLETMLPPRALLEALLELERESGRTRDFRNAPRTLDMDLLLYGDLVLQEPGLTLPHPCMHQRAFVLQPLLEIAPDCVIPGIGSAAEAMRQCADQRVAAIPSPFGRGLG